MRVNRGCGCLLLILAGFNGVLVILATVGLARGSFGTTPLGVLAVLLFSADLIAALMLGLAGVRGRTIGGADAPEESVGGEDEAERVDEGSE